MMGGLDVLLSVAAWLFMGCAAAGLVYGAALAIRRAVVRAYLIERGKYVDAEAERMRANGESVTAREILRLGGEYDAREIYDVPRDTLYDHW